MTEQHIDSDILRIQNKLREWGFKVTLNRNSKVVSWIEWPSDPLIEEEIVAICSWIQEDIESGKIARAELAEMGYGNA
jgi:hypothetical protein